MIKPAIMGLLAFLLLSCPILHYVLQRYPDSCHSFSIFWDIDPDIATTAKHTTLAFSVGRRLAHYCLLFRSVHNGKCGALNRGKPGYRKAKRIEKTKSLDGTWNWTWGTKTKNSEQSRAGQGMYCSSGLQELDLPFLLFTFLLSPP